MIENFYNRLAPYYKLLYQDWEASVGRQAAVLDGVIREYIGPAAKSILDAACGVGTQSFGLAQLGYRLTASDLSPSEIEQARLEAQDRKLDIKFQVLDMRQVWDKTQTQFDVVIACDNALPHLLNDDQILLALKQFYRCTAPGGGCIVTVRDYAQIAKKEQRQIYPRLVHPIEGGQIAIFDVWSFEGDCYEMTTYIVEDNGQAEAQTRVMRGGKYYCVEIATLERLFLEAGFRKVTTLRERFFQPLLVALR